MHTSDAKEKHCNSALVRFQENPGVTKVITAVFPS